MKWKLIGLFLALIIGLVYAAPQPWGIAINDETKECAGFWAGDEFTYYTLPAGWQDYYDQSYIEEGQISGKIVTPYGECTSFEIRNEEPCCEELGYSFVSSNVGIRATTISKPGEGGLIDLTLPFIGIVILIAIILLGFYFSKRKK